MIRSQVIAMFHELQLFHYPECSDADLLGLKIHMVQGKVWPAEHGYKASLPSSYEVQVYYAQFRGSAKRFSLSERKWL